MLFTSTCAAYPDKIPPDFLAGLAAHLTPREGDGGITFEPKDGMTTEEALSEAGPDAYRAWLQRTNLEPDASDDG